MSVYYLNKLFYSLETDEAFLAKFRSDINEALKEFRLTEEEIAAIKAGDIITLYRMGAHGFLLNVLARHDLCGVNRENYISRIRTLAGRSSGSRGTRQKKAALVPPSTRGWFKGPA